MKKTIIFLFILIGSLTFFACDKSSSTTNVTTVNQSTTSLQETTNSTTLLPTTKSVGYTSIEVTNQIKRFFRIDEPFDKTSIELTAHLNDGSTEIIDSNLIDVRGYNSSTPGSKTIFIVFENFRVELEVYVLEDFAIEIDMEYYEEALNLRGNTLKVALNHIINQDLTLLLYGDARDILQESDVDPNNSGHIILVYTGQSVNKTWDSGATWNREHVFPQSRLGVKVDYYNDFPSKATDIHNLKPADPGENASRSNDYFSTEVGNDFYEPRDEVKGDIARILFYMTTKYFDLSLNNDATSGSSLKSMGVLSLLLEWNEMDPVDDFEMNRNNVLYGYQGNRNPFIDYPEFANLIWGEATA